jgi:F-type H+-transporting ATPase subunit b
MFEALGIDLVSLIWQIVAFAVLIFLLNRMLFRPIRKTLDERSERIRTSMEEAERVKQQVLRADEEYEARIEEANRESLEILGQAREEAREERERIVSEAEAEAQQRRADAQSQIELERRDMLRDARQQVAGLAVLAASRIIDENLDAERNRRLAEQHVADLNEPLNELNRALGSFAGATVTAVQVRSAMALAEDLQDQIRGRVTAIFGEDIEILFSTDPALMGGFILQVGDQVVDLSVVRKLNDLFRELAA